MRGERQEMTLSGQRVLRLIFAVAEPDDVAALVELSRATASELTERFGRGHWSSETTERGVLFGMRQSQVWVARPRAGYPIVGTFRLATKKPWAIDRAYFAKSRRPLYLTDMGVRPDLQQQGIAQRCLTKALEIARAW